jgi:kojibiose phosphorylase
MTPIGNTLEASDDGWQLVERGWEPERAVAVASNFMVGNGYLGYRGTTPEQGADAFVALVVADTYDCADGHWRELTTAPNPLYVECRINGVALEVATADEVETTLDLRTGEFGATITYRAGDVAATVRVERFASYDNVHLLGQRWSLQVDRPVDVELVTGIDGDIWSLNGTHLPELTVEHDDAVSVVAGKTVESGIEVAVAAQVQLDGGDVASTDVAASDRSAMRRHRIGVVPDRKLIVETTAAVYSSKDVARPTAAAATAVAAGEAASYTTLRDASRERWTEIWKAIDIVVEGSPVAGAGVRFAAYHNRICTPAHTDHLPVGARGLSCQAYQGSAFWDQEVYNLPAFLFTEPEIARSLLVYRHKTLDGARRKAARLGYAGAFYAWISGDTGDELCPDIFFTDVLTGRPIRNHFNDWQMHVAPDVVTTLARYLEVTGDEQFLVDHGAEIAFEVARFLHSFVRYDEWREVYHCIRLLGPDEWHENVDDNAFTNYQVHRALSVAVDAHRVMTEHYPAELDDLAERIGLGHDEVEGWARVRNRMYLPQPAEDRLIEQFAGFFDLEDVPPDVVATRLLDPQEYWGWPNGVAVATQVSKQADVVMLMWLHGSTFDLATKRANYEYYEPRCSHNSSLSHAAHGMIAAEIGELEAAEQHFLATATVDLLSTQHPVVGGTFIGGIHTAACGGTYQLAMAGFGGLGFSDGMLTVDPRLPPSWTALEYPVVWRGNKLRVRIDGDQVVVTGDDANPGDVAMRIRGRGVAVPPGGTATG